MSPRNRDPIMLAYLDKDIELLRVRPSDLSNNHDTVWYPSCFDDGFDPDKNTNPPKPKKYPK